MTGESNRPEPVGPTAEKALITDPFVQNHRVSARSDPTDGMIRRYPAIHVAGLATDRIGLR
jgi:hypothetical protein